jgi:hypothetical protein
VKTLFIWHTPAGIDFTAVQFQPGILEPDRFTWTDWVEVETEQDRKAALACEDVVLIQVLEGQDRPVEGVAWRLGVTMIHEPGKHGG